MKRISIVVAGSGQIHDVDIAPGTTVSDVFTNLGLSDYLLSRGPKEPFLAQADTLYDKVQAGEKLFATTKAEVGQAA